MALSLRLLDVSLKTERLGGPLVNVYLSRCYSSQPTTKVKLTDLKRGRGGRSSFSGVVATVFGATGFFGRILINQLGKMGSQVIVPYRGDPYEYKELKLAGDLGQVMFMPYHIREEASLYKAIRNSNVVINLVSKDHETSNFSFEDIHVEFPRRLARLCKEQGVEKFIHFSHINATHNPEPILIKTGSKYLRTKAEGEEAVRQEFPEAIIFKPSDMFGNFDKFLGYYTKPARRWRVDEKCSVLPLWEKGQKTVKQPVYATNVAQGVVSAILDPTCEGRTFDALGPHRYRLDDLVRWIYLHLRYKHAEIRFFNFTPNYRMKVWLYSKMMPKYTPISMERIEREFHTDRPGVNNPTLDDLGVSPIQLEDRIAYELKSYRRFGFYWDALGEFPEPPSPPLQDDLDTKQYNWMT